ncbi:MAG: hypothetical protein ACREPL_00860 [Rhodanobacteraceae bacterium]
MHLVQAHGTPPQLLWVTCGNVTNARLNTFARAMALLLEGRPIVEVGDLP